MRHIHSLSLFFAALLCCASVFSQDDDWYLPGGFDADGSSFKTFSVSDTKKVHFSRGNLQYNAAQNKWRFAPRQYSMMCSDNNNAAADYDGWIDMFNWATSGWNSGATVYEPWGRSDEMSDFLDQSLTGDYANADWGVYNRITNGGNKAGRWRTMTSDEWTYLLGSNAARSGKSALATIGGVYKGLVLLPDEWTTPDGLSFSADISSYEANNYSFNDWQRMEAAGAVFLPAAGTFSMSSVAATNKRGYYWSATALGGGGANGVLFFENNLATSSNFGPNSGPSVRLIRDDNGQSSAAFDRDGASYKRFSVSDTSTVRFSKGNLQYNAAQDEWRFAAKQYLYVGDGNANASQDYDGWINLPFTSSSESYYYPGGAYTNSLTGEYVNADWGYNNPINNGGNKVTQWRTLTNEEWTYLMGENVTRSGKYGLATIRGSSNSYTGLVLLPDDWTLPNGVTFTAGTGSGFTTNTYTTNQWQKMEAAGALFLPASGARSGTNVSNVGLFGYYWSSTFSNEYSAERMYFNGDVMALGGGIRYFGLSVRLVRD